MPYHSQARPSSLPPAPSPAGGASPGCLHRSVLFILRAAVTCESSLCPAPGIERMLNKLFSFFLTEGCCLTEFCCFPPINCPVISLMLLTLLVPPTALMKHLGLTAICEAFNPVIFSLQHCGGGCVVAKSCPTLATPGTVARQVPLSLGFSRQDYWSGLPFPLPGDLPNPGIEPASYALSGGFFITEPPGKPSLQCDFMQIIKILCVFSSFYDPSYFKGI